MVALGDADAMVTGVTRNYSIALDDVRRVIDAKPGHRVIGVSLVPGARPHRARRRHRDPRDADRGRSSPRSRSRRPASRAGSATSRASRCSPSRPSAIRRASAPRRSARRCSILDAARVDFEYDGEMAADVALNRELMAHYPFCRLTGPANVLVMPAFHSASISTKMLQELGGATVIGPLIVGLDKPVQIVLARRQGLRHRQHGGAGGLQYRRVTNLSRNGAGKRR